MTTLRTPRLLLRRAQASDLYAFHAVLSEPAAMRYWSTGPHTTLAETRLWLEAMRASPEELSEDFVIEYRGNVIGKVGAYRLPEFGFILHPDHWGLGLGYEAASAVVAHIFATRNVEVLRADVDPRNDASRKLLAKLGFIETGTEERTFCINGVWADSIYLELRRPC